MKTVLFLFVVLTVAVVLVLLFKRRTPQTTKTIPTSTIEPMASPSSTAKYIYPIARYFDRVKIRRFGQFLTAKDVALVSCGAEFTGFHTGDDLEIFPEELNNDLPVYAVSDGVVNSAEYVPGYGGLIVISTKLLGKPVTIYYGHINIGSTQLDRGDRVKAGEKLATLGNQCSSETNGERKHLHFAIHLGTVVDVRGYVPTQKELFGWINPAQMLRDLSAGEPGS